MKKILLLSLFAFACVSAQAQRIAISNNLLFDALGSLSIGIEIPVAKKSSWETYGSIRPWKQSSESVNKHWSVQTQFRFWPCQVMNGFFWGPYIHGAQFNIGNKGFPFKFIDSMRDNRYEGWLIGGGIGVGYQFVLAKHWNLGAEIGAGYTYIKYTKNDCEICGRLQKDTSTHYWGINRFGLSVIYIF